MRSSDMTPDPTSERCTWCGTAVAGSEGYRVGEDAGARRAVFCRLEHVVPWAMKGARWETGEPDPEPTAEGVEDAPDTCAACDASLGSRRVTLVRHRAEHRIPDAFCSVDHFARWANAGGRYARP